MTSTVLLKPYYFRLHRLKKGPMNRQKELENQRKSFVDLELRLLCLSVVTGRRKLTVNTSKVKYLDRKYTNIISNFSSKNL